MDHILGILIVSEHQPTVTASVRAVAGLRCDRFELFDAETCSIPLTPARVANDVLLDARTRAKAFLNRRKTTVKAAVLIAATLEGAIQQLVDAGPSLRLGICIVHGRSISPAPHTPNCLAPSFDTFFAAIEAAGVRCLRSPDSVTVIIPQGDYDASPYQSSIDYRVRVEPSEDWVLETDLTVGIVNYIQFCYTSPLAKRRLQGGKQESSLGVYLADLMRSRFGTDWLLSYYTGSIVSLLIKTLQARANAQGARSVRGPNEHSLACASFINWRLYRRGFLMVVTSAMIDELKGTLANLQQSGAKGIIVCGDALPTKWFGFQATINTDADIRGVLAARHIPFIYLQSGAEIPASLETAAAMLDQALGPIVIIATQQALEASFAEPPRLPEPQPMAPYPTGSSVCAQIDRVMQIINTDPVHLLWQCGALSDAELALVLEIAERSGIALCDSLSAPGFVPSHRDGKPVEAYIGMLGQYGTNREVYQFLQTGPDFNPLDEQWLFVLKGKLGQIDSPYSDSAHSNKLRIVQVNRRADHIAPFADLGIQMPVLDFLKGVRQRLDVSLEVLHMRRDKLRTTRRRRRDLLGCTPSLPMHPQYFLGQLSRIVRSLIAEHQYRYTGMFDVGHCGTLAASWLPRTDPSFSGWYGRGLMGDALLGSAALVTTGENNVISVIGDGAKHIVPDIVPNVVENLAAYGRRIGKNVTIFFLVNNCLSAINTYQERIMCQHGGRQMLVHNTEALTEPDGLTSVAGNVISRRRLTNFDQRFIRDALLARNQINLFSVPVSTNNDGIIIVDRDSWHFADA